jgi:hypothetical protein
MLLLPVCAFAQIYAQGNAGYEMETGFIITNLGVGYQAGLWHVTIDLYANVKVMMEYGGRAAFHPFNDTYTAGLVLDYKGVFVRIEHFCSHPVYSYREQFNRYFSGGNSTTVSVGFTTKR